MAKTIVDASAFSCSWFKEVLPEILESEEKVKFVFTNHRRMVEEIEKNGDYARLFKVLEGDPRRIVVKEEEFERYYLELTNAETWLRHRKDCDDGHIFALVRARNVKYVFSVDARMAKCRGCLRNKLDRKYASFLVVGTKEIYLEKRHMITA